MKLLMLPTLPGLFIPSAAHDTPVTVTARFYAGSRLHRSGSAYASCRTDH